MTVQCAFNVLVDSQGGGTQASKVPQVRADFPILPSCMFSNSTCPDNGPTLPTVYGLDRLRSEPPSLYICFKLVFFCVCVCVV